MPEVAVHLIQEDLRITREQAIATLEESTVFGKLMHPGDDDTTLQIVQNKVADMFGRANHDLLEQEAIKTEGDDSGISLNSGLNAVMEDGHMVYILDDSDDD